MCTRSDFEYFISDLKPTSIMNPELRRALNEIITRLDRMDGRLDRLESQKNKKSKIEQSRQNYGPRRTEHNPLGVKPSVTPAYVSRPSLSKEERDKAVVVEFSCENIGHPLRYFRCQGFGHIAAVCAPETLMIEQVPEDTPLSTEDIELTYITDPAYAEEYEKYEDEIHEEDSYRIEVENQVEKIVRELSHKEEHIIDLIETTKLFYCVGNTIDHIEMIIGHDRSEINSFDSVNHTYAYPRFNKNSTPIDLYRQMAHETEWLATRTSNWCAVQFARYFWRTLWHLLGIASLVILTYSPHAYNQN
ncbi:hypothetical protein AXF42_Ash013423 [Apostasia shenzhenica]|uniref:Uncharacterized protein n=1 Tax=Apostasia shenzhenica TaxID=1088818 RepID=A0A2I0A472_9ASPA|nr:hypothetical protein AXF42_Ash013423 [Apostasia shenzhenica]